MKPTLRILGTAAGPGLPSFYCHCVACEEARANPALQRTRTGLCLYDGDRRLLIDASPDLRSQLLRANVDHVERVYLTHWHPDHFLGLTELEFFVRLQTRVNVPLVLPPSAVELYETMFPDILDIFDVSCWEFGTPYKDGAFTLTMLPAEHGIETAGVLMESDDKRVAYFPDTNCQLAPSVKDAIRHVDLLICDSSFHGENWFPHAHMNVTEAVALAREVEAKETLLTHLAVHYAEPITMAELEKELAPAGSVHIALDDMIITM